MTPPPAPDGDGEVVHESGYAPRCRRDGHVAMTPHDALARLVAAVEWYDATPDDVAWADVSVALAVAQAALGAGEPGYLISCPWCGGNQQEKIQQAQMSHLIECGDRQLADLRARLAACEAEREKIAAEMLKWSQTAAAARLAQAQAERDLEACAE